MKPPNRRIKPPSEKEQELRRNHLETLNIWGKSQSPFCYMHLALALEPAGPEICQSKATALKWRCIH